MIRIENLVKKYKNIQVFDHASLIFPSTGLVCIVGPSGCGKSTLLNLIAGFDSDYDGNIFIHDTLISKINHDELCSYRRDNIGFIFQNYNLISGYNALDNIILASDVMNTSKTESEVIAKKLLDKMGLSNKIYQKVETLSGGQKQRVAIARALINNPSIILADEPTGALDRKNSSEIMELLKTLSKGRLILVITHDKKICDYADQVITISNGKLVSQSETLNSSDSLTLRKFDTPKLSMFKRALINFKVHLPRFITIASMISIGILCFTLSFSFGNIIQESIHDFEEKNTAYNNGYIKVENNQNQLLDILSKDKRIDNIYQQYVLNDITLKIENKTVTMEEKYPMAKSSEKMSYGVMPRFNKNEIALSPSIAAKFDKNIQDLIGKTAIISYDNLTYSCTISGIYNASYDDFFISSDIEQKLYENIPSKVYSISYDVINFDDIVSVNKDLLGQNIKSQNASAEVEVFQNTFKNLNRLFTTISILIFIVGLFISSILLVKQQNTRYHEVGLLSALGYRKINIQSMILYESLMLSIITTVFLLILTAFAFMIGKVINFSLLITVPQILIATLFTIMIILIICYFSSFKLVHIEPAKALRK